MVKQTEPTVAAAFQVKDTSQGKTCHGLVPTGEYGKSV